MLIGLSNYTLFFNSIKMAYVVDDVRKLMIILESRLHSLRHRYTLGCIPYSI